MKKLPLVGQNRLSRSHSDPPQSVGLLWTSDQPDAETSIWQHTTITTDRHPCPRWDSNPQFHALYRAATGTGTEIYMLHSKIENAQWAEKLTTTRCGIRETSTTRNYVLWLFLNNHNALWHERNCHNAKLRVVALSKQPQRVVAWEKLPQREMPFKWTVCMFSNSLIKIHVTWANEEQWRSSFIFAGTVRMTLRITLRIFRTTFALCIDAVPFTMAPYKSLLTSKRYHWGWPKR